jgi:hypothetical protein
MSSRCLLVVLMLAGVSHAGERVDYAREVKPILAQKCFACHGSLKQESGLRLDAASAIRKGGDSGPAIVPGEAAKSRLIERVSATDVDVRMPPEGEGEPLDAKQLALFKAWIDQGAEAPDEPLPPGPREHWAFQPPVKSPLPAIKHSERTRNPIDVFIAAQHERLGLSPLPPAEKHILLRRIYLDLVGLPPTVDELHAFLNDDAANAYERVVARLLERPEYGQRWGRHWMDVWRYSDWAGYKQEVRESQRHIWRWRDWIIESLNADKGYDQMVQEMLAGDELSPGDADVLRATGFLVRNRHSSNRNVWLDATVEHTAKAFLGLTINCARCHDHKFDPIPQVDYYRLRAVFEPHDVVTDRLVGQPDLVKDGLVHVFDGRPEEPTYLYLRGNEKSPDKEHPVQAGLPEVLARELAIEPVSFPPAARYRGVRKEFETEDLAAADSRVAQAKAALEKARKTDNSESTDADQQPAPAVVLAEARYAAAQAERESLAARWQADFARYSAECATGDAPASGPTDAEELAARAAKAERQAAVAKAEATVLQAEQALATAKEAKKPDDAKAKAALTKAEKDLTAAKAAQKKAVEAAEKTDPNYTPVVKALPAQSTGRRLALARWITRADNPLAARVAVNHIWLRHFGSPLVENVFDFGLRSPQPPLAELLDWLAVELIEHQWSMKHLHRLIVTSSTYRLASAGGEPGEQNQKIDPDNRALWRMNTRRLEAELVRDGLLFVGGNLNLATGGPDIDQDLGESSRRRSVYFRHAYEKQMPFLMLFDAANVNECYRRSESVIPQQALAIANSSLSLRQSRLVAAELSEATGCGTANDKKFIERAFERILSRPPSADELSACHEFLADQAARLADAGRLTAFSSDKSSKNAKNASASAVNPSPDARQRARENLVHVLLNHNDFVTIR